MDNATATTSNLPFISRPPSKPSAPPSHDDRPLSIPALPPKLYLHILSLLSVGYWSSIQTLLTASLVSRAFRVAASIPSVWNSHLDRWFPRKPAHWVRLPTTCDLEDQRFLDELFGPERRAKLSGKEGFGIRFLLQRFAEGHVRRLILEPVGKLRSFDVLCVLGPMVWNDITRLAHEDSASGLGAEMEGTELTRQYWVHEVAASMERREAARIWRGIDEGTLCASFWDRMEWGTACFAAFAQGSVEYAYPIFWRLFSRIEDEVTHQIPKPDEEVKSLPADAPALLVHAQLLQAAENIFKAIVQNLSMNHVEPLVPGTTGSEAYPQLDGCFLNLLYVDMHHSRHRLDRAISLFYELEERGAFPSELKPYWDKIMAHETPNTNLTLFTCILVSVAREFDEHFLALWPTEERRVFKTVMSTNGLFDDDSEGEEKEARGRREAVEARCLLDVVTGEGKLESVEDGTGKYSPLSVYESIRRLALDIQSIATSPTAHPSSNVTPEQALYASFLVPSVISQPHTGPEAVIHLTSAALKLAEHVSRHFPFDVSLVETWVLPLVWGNYARGTIEGIVREVRKRDGEVVVRRRGEGAPEGRVGQLCIHKEKKLLGVVVGWDEEFSGASCERLAEKEAEVAPDTLVAGKQQAFYHIIWSSLPIAKHISITYHASESLSFDIKPFVDYDEEDVEELQRVPQLGRWFGHWEFRELETEEGDVEVELRYVPSAELRVMYPDDV